MIVVVIIGLLAAIAIPAFARVRENSQISAFASDLRTGRDAFEIYVMENGVWPNDGSAGMPPVMREYLNMDKFSGPTPLGGRWDWDSNVFGFTAGLSVDQPTADLNTMLRVDRKIDDGNLASGSFRARSGGYIWVLEL
ncbi:MAG: hypothetical protein SynsKO_11210 [Synoicihabitans sp.]